MSSHFVHSKLKLGSRLGFLCMRLGEAFVVGFILYFIPYLTPIRESAIPLAIIAYTFARAHEVAYGFADDVGIHFKRYFRWNFASWDQVESITQTSRISIAVALSGKSIVNRKVLFLENPPLSELVKKPKTFPELRAAWMEGRK
jgi:hypothetical protein